MQPILQNRSRPIGPGPCLDGLSKCNKFSSLNFCTTGKWGAYRYLVYSLKSRFISQSSWKASQGNSCQILQYIILKTSEVSLLESLPRVHSNLYMYAV